MTIASQFVEDSVKALITLHANLFTNSCFPYYNKTSTLIIELLRDKEISLFWNDLETKRGSSPYIIGLDVQSCKKKGISKAFSTVVKDQKTNEKTYLIYYNSSLSATDSKIYILMELMNIFHWEYYVNYLELAKNGEVTKSQFAYLCEAREWHNLHLVSRLIYRVNPQLCETEFDRMVNDFDYYYEVQKKLGHTRKYTLQYDVFRAVGLFKRLVFQN